MVLRVAIIIFGLASAGLSQTLPDFRSFPAKDIYQGKVARPQLVTSQDREFRTQLREAALQKPNFVGHYVLATFGCGAQCIMGTALDAETASVTWIPFTICCWDQSAEPISFRKDSNLILFRGSRNEKGNGTYYYTLTGGHFNLLREDEKTHTPQQ